MKFKVFSSVILLFVPIFGSNIIFAKKVMNLPGLAKPYLMAVSDDKVYVSDISVKFMIYSLKNFTLVKDVLKKGIGPKECQFLPYFQVYPDYICINSFPDKVMFFSKEGVYKNEFREKLNGWISFYPVGKNYVLNKTDYTNRLKEYTKDFIIYTYENNEAKYKKLFYSYIPPKKVFEGAKEKVSLIRDYTDFIVYDNKIFLGDTQMGLYVLIFDSNGNQIGRVKIPEEKIKVTEQFKTSFLDFAKKYDPALYVVVSKTQTFTLPEYFPSFFRFAVDRGKIYFLTYKFKEDKREVIVADFKGNVLKRAYVPLTKGGVDQTFAIDNDKYYYILENEDTEEYELHVADIK